MPTICLVTCTRLTAPTRSDALFAEALRGRGHDVTWAAWTDPSVAWAAFDRVILRSTWDYFLRFDEFMAWLDGVERDGARLLNPPSLVRWNAHKRYLAELEARGAAVVPTAWLRQGEAGTAVALDGTERVVVKPAVSGGAHETWVTALPFGAMDRARIEALRREVDLLVQPFLPAIAEEGEISALFLGGRFSHAVRKRPKPGDFRVQVEHGGLTEAITLEPAWRAAAEEVLALVPAPTLYARIDLVRWEGKPRVMEVEVIEPDLFLDYAPGAAERLAAAVG